MKTWIKKLSALVFTLVMAMGLSLAVFADSTVTFKSAQEGFEMTSGGQYTDTDLFEDLKGAMPGDLLTETVQIKNEAKDSDLIRVYLRAQPHDDVTNPPVYQDGEETVASMQDFLSQLTMRVYNGSELIYEGTPDQSNQLAENVCLGDIPGGQTMNLSVELEVPADLGNEYANRAGEVDWVFLAEGITYQNLTVNKIWNDNGYPGRPNSVDVDLLRDGQVYQTVTLNGSNGWSHTWQQLDDRYTWTVQEQVPQGYDVRYDTNGGTVTITNHMNYVPPAQGEQPTATPTAKPATPTLPQTSDALPLTALVVVLIVAAVAIVALVVLRRRKNNGSNDQQ